MSAPASNGPKWRASPFTRNSPSPSPGPTPVSQRPKSTITPSSLGGQSFGHSRNQSLSHLAGLAPPSKSDTVRLRSNSDRHSMAAPGGTFAPQFIKSEEMQDATERVRGIEGENDFSGKRYVWMKDPTTSFVRGWVVEDLEGGRLLVQCDDGSVRSC